MSTGYMYSTLILFAMCCVLRAQEINQTCVCTVDVSAPLDGCSSVCNTTCPSVESCLGALRHLELRPWGALNLHFLGGTNELGDYLSPGVLNLEGSIVLDFGKIWKITTGAPLTLYAHNTLHVNSPFWLIHIPAHRTLRPN